MPLYEYQCDSCGAAFELIRKFSDPPLEACPTCGGAVQKLVSSPAFQFKGSGWYATDYAKKSGAPASSAEPVSSAKSDKADSGTAPTKDAGTPAAEKPVASPAPAAAPSTSGKDK